MKGRLEKRGDSPKGIIQPGKQEEAVAKRCSGSKNCPAKIDEKATGRKRRSNLYLAIPIAKSSPYFESVIKNSKIKGVGKCHFAR